MSALVWHLLGLLNKLDIALQRHLLREWVLDLAYELLDFADLGVPRPALVGEGMPRLALPQERYVLDQLVEAIHR